MSTIEAAFSGHPHEWLRTRLEAFLEHVIRARAGERTLGPCFDSSLALRRGSERTQATDASLL